MVFFIDGYECVGGVGRNVEVEGVVWEEAEKGWIDIITNVDEKKEKTINSKTKTKNVFLPFPPKT